jgi:hypothetical protein
MANDYNLIPAKKGEVRNPKGRPKGLPNARTRYKRLLELVTTKTNPVTGELEEFTQLELMDIAVFNKALKGDLNAYKEILDRLEGKAQQSIDMSLAVDPRKQILEKYGLGDGDDREAKEA